MSALNTTNKKLKKTARWPAHQVPDEDQLQRLHEKLSPAFLKLLHDEQIPSSEEITGLYRNLYLPFCQWLAYQHRDQPLIIGINGSQGSGKSTLTRILEHGLTQGFGKRVISVSIDDLYKTRSDRQQLAEAVHPLFMTRGVPGTHDMELIEQTFKHLKQQPNCTINLPRFDKATDDRLPENQWINQNGCDILLFEGWCVGACPQPDDALETAINELEASEDSAGLWRQYVNQQLKEQYASVFSSIDLLIHLAVPSFEKVYEWRQLQEEKLRNKIQQSSEASKVMTADEVKRFIMHYERLTRHTLDEMPSRSDIVFRLGDDHLIHAVETRQKE